MCVPCVDGAEDGDGVGGLGGEGEGKEHLFIV